MTGNTYVSFLTLCYTKSKQTSFEFRLPTLKFFFASLILNNMCICSNCGKGKKIIQIRGMTDSVSVSVRFFEKRRKKSTKFSIFNLV